MPSLNKVMLMGNLTRDPEMRSLPVSGRSVASFGLAVNRKGKRQDGTDWEEVLFVDVEFFGKQAETLRQWVKQGDPLFVEGRLKLNRWETSAGEKRSKLRVIGEGFQFLPRRAHPDRPPRGATPEPVGVVSSPSVSEEDVPF